MKGHWLVRCSCEWTTLSAEWAAQSGAKIHARLGPLQGKAGWTKKEHVVSVEPPHEAKDHQAQGQASLRDEDNGER
jgi:hypothetical protein